MKENKIETINNSNYKEKSIVLIKALVFADDPVRMLEKLKVDKANGVGIKEMSPNLLNLCRLFESESQVALMESLDEKYRGLAKEMTRTIIQEQNCITEIEKSLAELAVNAYIRVLDNSRRINNEFNAGTITQNRTLYIAQLSKQIDRSNRQYIQAILTLNQIKNPIIRMNIKTETAFISQNQQINNNENNNTN